MKATKLYHRYVPHEFHIIPDDVRMGILRAINAAYKKGRAKRKVRKITER